jgi:hypothetical protein
VALAVSLGAVATADEQADAKAIVDEGIKAQGGEATLSTIVGMYLIPSQVFCKC